MLIQQSLFSHISVGICENFNLRKTISPLWRRRCFAVGLIAQKIDKPINILKFMLSFMFVRVNYDPTLCVLVSQRIQKKNI